MPKITLEQRITALEKDVLALKEAMASRPPKADWIHEVIGLMRNEPAFDEVLAYGRAIREADRPTEDTES